MIYIHTLKKLLKDFLLNQTINEKELKNLLNKTQQILT